MFAVRFIPDRHGLGAIRGKELERAKLGVGLMGKSVANADGEFFRGSTFQESWGGGGAKKYEG